MKARTSHSVERELCIDPTDALRPLFAREKNEDIRLLALASGRATDVKKLLGQITRSS